MWHGDETPTRRGDRVCLCDRAQAEPSTVALRHTIEVGQITVHRAVAGAYEWRDAGYRARAAKKAKAWEGSRVWDPGD